MKEITFGQENLYEDAIKNTLKQDIQIIFSCILERKSNWMIEKKKKNLFLDLLHNITQVASSRTTPRANDNQNKNLPLPLQTILKDRRKEKFKNFDELDVDDDQPTVCLIGRDKSKEKDTKHQRTQTESLDFNEKIEHTNQSLNVQEKLFQLIVNNNLEEFKKLFFEEKVNPNLYHPKEHKTLLHQAIAHGRMKFIEFIVENGANVNENDKQQRSPLLLACSTGNKEICIYLLGNGAKISHKDAYGYSPLFLALKKHYFHLTNDLILFGADINMKKDNGMTPLHEALYNNDEKMLDEILQIKGLKLNIKDTSQKTPLLKACESSSVSLFMKFLKFEGVDINSFDESGRNIFHILCIHKREDILKELYKLDLKDLSKFRNLVAQPDNIKKNTPLYFAIENGSFPCVKFLFSICDKLKMDPINEPNLYEVAYKNLEREYILACSSNEGMDYNDIFELIKKDFKFIEQVIYPLQKQMVKQNTFTGFASKSLDEDEIDFILK